VAVSLALWDPPAWRGQAGSGAGDEVIMCNTGHVSRAMLSRYAHMRMEAKLREQGTAQVLQIAAVH